MCFQFGLPKSFTYLWIPLFARVSYFIAAIKRGQWNRYSSAFKKSLKKGMKFFLSPNLNYANGYSLGYLLCFHRLSYNYTTMPRKFKSPRFEGDSHWIFRKLTVASLHRDSNDYHFQIAHGIESQATVGTQYLFSSLLTAVTKVSNRINSKYISGHWTLSS